MKTGIYLGPSFGRTRTLGRALVSVGIIGTLFHGGAYWRQSNELAALRADIESREGGGASMPSELDDDARALLARLSAASQSGVTTTTAPTQVLRIIAAALPDDVALVGIAVEASSARPSLVVDAIARREEDVTALERGMAASHRVASTKLLGERTAADGSLSVRLQVDLRP